MALRPLLGLDRGTLSVGKTSQSKHNPFFQMARQTEVQKGQVACWSLFRKRTRKGAWDWPSSQALTQLPAFSLWPPHVAGREVVGCEQGGWGEGRNPRGN